MFLRDEPIGPEDRVLAGLSVAFDAPARRCGWPGGTEPAWCPRPALVRSGMDLGPWLVSHDVTVVSTVPTLASLWPAEALEAVRLLIFGGEARPPDLAERLVVEGREVEHLRADRGHRGGLRGEAGRAPRSASGCPCRAGTSSSSTAAASRSRWARSVNSSSAASGWPATWTPRRTPRSTPRCRRWAGAAPTAAATWSAARGGRTVFPGPRRRPGQGRRPAHRTGRGGLRAGASPRCQRRRRRGPAHRQRHTAAGRLHRQRRPELRPGRSAGGAVAEPARRAGAPPGARR